jgi:hypothetical protein
MIIEANINTEESSKSKIPEVPDETIVEPRTLKTKRLERSCLARISSVMRI